MNVQSGMVFVLFVLPLSLVVSWPETNFRKWQVLRNRKDKLHDSVLMADTGKSVIFPWAILATDTQKDTEREREKKKLYVVNEREEEKVEYRKCEILTDKTSFFPCCCWFWIEQRAKKTLSSKVLLECFWNKPFYSVNWKKADQSNSHNYAIE